ncbi:hypothetical protein [Alienimonas californiensis]|uniref:Uncharacterized protein n=1 Tax=Alienimonas californiensis TaxID=2527989 RepID=A0A517P5Q7_9PLAN|nr:hypothetical protein [Alienimonas californiensis]QDT14703.1 hypothetical protein CA12_07810 [Alienimonas californiensis]
MNETTDGRAAAGQDQENVRVYRWPQFELRFDLGEGVALTRYPDGKTSGCGPVPEDCVHAERLGVTPARHRLLHELTHHLVGLRYYGDPRGSRVIWRDAHGTWSETPKIKPGWNENAQEEWFVHAVSYAALGKLPDRESDEDGLHSALADLSERTDPDALIRELQSLLAQDAPVVDGRPDAAETASPAGAH